MNRIDSALWSFRNQICISVSCIFHLKKCIKKTPQSEEVFLIVKQHIFISFIKTAFFGLLTVMVPRCSHAVCSRFVFFLSLSLGFLFLLFLFLCPFVGVCVHGWDLSWVASSGQTHLWQSTTCSWLSHEADSFFTGLLNYSVKPWHLLSCVLCADSDISWFWLCVSCVHRCQDFPPWCVVSQDPEFERERECYL